MNGVMKMGYVSCKNIDVTGKLNLFVYALSLIAAVVFIFPQLACADESNSQGVYDGDQSFTTTVVSLSSGQGLFSIGVFEIIVIENDNVKIYNTVASGEGYGSLSPSVLEYKSGSLEAGDILHSIPSITTKDEKMLGVLIPPFAYFSKKF